MRKEPFQYAVNVRNAENGYVCYTGDASKYEMSSTYVAKTASEVAELIRDLMGKVE